MFFWYMLAVPALAIACFVAAPQVISKTTAPTRKIDAAYTFFLLLGALAACLAIQSHDESFGAEFGIIESLFDS